MGRAEGTTWIIINCNVQVSILMTCVMNNSVRIPFRSYFELGAKQELFSEIVNITHTTLKKHNDSLEMYYGIIMESG